MNPADADTRAIALLRDCPASTVPQGEPVALCAGGIVEVVQRRGGSITVRTELGALLHIDADDADALGLSPAEGKGSVPTTGPFDMGQVTAALNTVYDPGIPVSIVDLGLVYGVTVDDANIATVDMTLTSAACPLTDVIEDQTRAALTDVVADFRINWVWMPPWGPDKITDDGREMLRALGFNV